MYGQTTNGHSQTAPKVLHLINGDDYSGGERVQDLLGLRLPDFGYAVHYVCLKPGRFDGPVRRRRCRWTRFP